MFTRNSPYNKVYNRCLIIRNLYIKKLSRAELSRVTGLSRAAITMIVEELINEGLVKEAEVSTNNNVVGRNPKLLEIVSDRYYILCVDIAREKCSIGIVEVGGKIVFAGTGDIRDAVSPEEAVTVISDKIKKSIISEKIDISRLLGLGITTPGPVDTVNGIIDEIPDFELWRRFPIVEAFKKYFDMTVVLQRDANAIALAEMFFGFGKKFDDFMCIMSYVGIGFGVVKNRNLYKGKLGLTPELGHVSIDYNGEPCVCGNRGCLYHYYGLQIILKSVQKNYPNICSWEEIVDRANEGETYFINIIDHYARILSIAIVNAINIFAQDKVILSGFVIYKPDIFLKALRKHVNNSYIARSFFDVDIYTTDMTYHENIIGAASSVIDNYLKIVEG